MDAIVAHTNVADQTGLTATHPPTALSTPTDLAPPAAVATRAFDALPIAIAVLDSRGRVVITNACGRREPRLPAALMRCGAALARRVVETQTAVGETHRDATGALWLVGAPLVATGGAADLVLVAATDPASTHPIEARVIGDLCGLTPAEAQTARMVLAGGTPKTIARALGVSLATVKTHLHRVFTKTETAGQADLARRLARILAPAPSSAPAVAGRTG